MSKVRVHQLAKELQIESKVLLQRMKSLSIVVVSHQSTLTPEQIEKIKASYQKKATTAPARPKILIRRRKRETPVAEETAAASATPAPEPPPPQPEVTAPVLDPAPELPAVEESKPPAVEPAVAATPPEKPPETTPAVAAKKVTKSKAAVVAEDYGKVKSSSKSRRATVAHTREILRSMEDDIDALTEEPRVRPTTTPTKTVYVPTGATKRRDLKRKKNLHKTIITTSKAAYRLIRMGETIQVSSLARQLRVKAKEIIQKLAEDDIEANIDTEIDFDAATLVATAYNFEVRSNLRTLRDILALPAGADATARERPPVVTVMGHVDHGKTSILDAVRKTNVAEGEAGGITQHIGAYTVDVHGKSLTFIDTPGHEAFSAMRVRGAKVTDIVILVVAADDGVMPQTIESIAHARNAAVPIIVALNKIDKPDKNLDRIFGELSERGVQVEKWGGEVQCVEVSAKENIGIDTLLEAVLLQAEVMELKADYDDAPSGTVIEAHLDKHRGVVATVIVQRGTLQRGDYVATASGYARVRAMIDHRGKLLPQAGVSTPVQVTGFAQVPAVGDPFTAARKEKIAKEISAWYQHESRREHEPPPAIAEETATSSLDALFSQAAQAETPQMSLIIKADTQGSAEAVAGSLTNIKSDKVENKIVHQGVGAVVESDVMLASASDALIVAFNVRAHKNIEDLARKRGVQISYFAVIYEIIDAVRMLMAGLLPPEVSEVVIGQAEVRNPISIPRVGLIAGSSVTSGRITRDAHLRLLRDAAVIHRGRVSSLKRFKEDVREVALGYECGIGIEGCQDIRAGDVIEAYLKEESMPSL